MEGVEIMIIKFRTRYAIKKDGQYALRAYKGAGRILKGWAVERSFRDEFDTLERLHTFCKENDITDYEIEYIEQEYMEL